jgi:hypothetical protein
VGGCPRRTAIQLRDLTFARIILLIFPSAQRPSAGWSSWGLMRKRNGHMRRRDFIALSVLCARQGRFAKAAAQRRWRNKDSLSAYGRSISGSQARPDTATVVSGAQVWPARVTWLDTGPRLGRLTALRNSRSTSAFPCYAIERRRVPDARRRVCGASDGRARSHEAVLPSSGTSMGLPRSTGRGRRSGCCREPDEQGGLDVKRDRPIKIVRALVCVCVLARCLNQNCVGARQNPFSTVSVKS